MYNNSFGNISVILEENFTSQYSFTYFERHYSSIYIYTPSHKTRRAFDVNIKAQTGRNVETDLCYPRRKWEGAA